MIQCSVVLKDDRMLHDAMRYDAIPQITVRNILEEPLQLIKGTRHKEKPSYEGTCASDGFKDKKKKRKSDSWHEKVTTALLLQLGGVTCD